MIRPTGVPLSTRTFLGAPPTLFPGARSNDAKPGRKNAPRERDGLFDMVREIVARIERSEIRGRWLPHFAALNAAKLRRAKNQPSRVVGSAPLFPACYLQ